MPQRAGERVCGWCGVDAETRRGHQACRSVKNATLKVEVMKYKLTVRPCDRNRVKDIQFNATDRAWQYGAAHAGA